MKSSIEVIGRVKRNIKEMSKSVALQVIDCLGQPDKIDLTISYVSESEIKRLNRVYRNIDKITDVLSFPSTNTLPGNILDINSPENKMLIVQNGNIHLGDMAICLKRASEQATEFGTTLEVELKKLIIHSILHLLGYDHIDDADYLMMHEKEIELDKKIEI